MLGLLNEFLRVLATGSEGRGALGGRGRVVVVVVAMAVGGRAAAVARTDGSQYRRVSEPSCSYGKPSRKDDIPLLKCATKDADEPRRHPIALFNGQRESSRRTPGNRTVAGTRTGAAAGLGQGPRKGLRARLGNINAWSSVPATKIHTMGWGVWWRGKKNGSQWRGKGVPCAARAHRYSMQ